MTIQDTNQTGEKGSTGSRRFLSRLSMATTWTWRKRGATTLALLIVVGIGIFVRLTVRDRWAGISLLSYALPWPVLLVMAFATAGIAATLSKRHILAASIAAFIVIAVMTIHSTVFQANVERDEANLRVHLWNVRKPDDPESVRPHVESENADLVAIVEAGRASEDAWKGALPNYSVRRLGHGMVVATKGSIDSVVSIDLSERDHGHDVLIIMDGKPISVVVVDFSAAPYRSRAPGFDTLRRYLEEHPTSHRIVMGDFNTPLDSVHMDDLRRSMDHTFAQAGNGWGATWPVPAPVLMLDHILVSRSIRACDCRLGWSTVSDHRSVTADLEIER